MIKIFKKFLRPYTGKIIAVVLLTIVTTLGNLLLPMMSKRILDEGAIKNDNGVITQSLIIMIIIAVVTILISILMNFISSKAAMGFSRDLRNGFFKHVSSLSQGDINKFGAATLISRQTNDITQLQTILVQVLQIMLIAPIMVIGGLAMAIKTAPSMSWLIFAMLPVAVVILLVIMKKVTKTFRSLQVKLDAVNRIIRENLNGMRVIRAFNREEYEQEHFGQANKEYKGLAEKANKLMLTMIPLITAVVNAINILVIWFGSHYMDDGIVSYGDIQAFIQYVSMILMAFMLCGMILIIVPRGQISAQRINEVLETQASVTDPEDAASISKDAESSITFENVTFSYPGADKPVISSMSFSAKRGQKLAIIGGTGSGKSTILNLITRDYDVTSGRVLVDGVDVRQLKLEELQSKLAVVPQKAFLFGGSIIDNIRYGKEDATAEEVEHALYISQSKEFVDQKEYGMYTYITPGGTNVSGGQRQRLAIARALIRHPDIYIFDDSFSALDFKTDAKIRKLLKSEVKDSVMIVVAQRVSTIKDADVIIVVDNGTIVGKGTHDELMQSCDIYREIALSQTSESEGV